MHPAQLQCTILTKICQDELNLTRISLCTIGYNFTEMQSPSARYGQRGPRLLAGHSLPETKTAAASSEAASSPAPLYMALQYSFTSRQ